MTKKKLAKTLAAIEELFSDTSVTQENTLEQLEEVRDDIDMKIECIKNDLKNGR